MTLSPSSSPQPELSPDSAVAPRAPAKRTRSSTTGSTRCGGTSCNAFSERMDIGSAPTSVADDFPQPPRSYSSGPIAGAITNRGAPLSLARIHNLSISLDGFAIGEPQSADAPFGHAGERLHKWMFGTPVLGRGRNRWSRRRLRRASQPRHRRRDHGRQQVRPARLAGRPETGKAGGREPAIPHPTFVLTHGRPRSRW